MLIWFHSLSFLSVSLSLFFSLASFFCSLSFTLSLSLSLFLSLFLFYCSLMQHYLSLFLSQFAFIPFPFPFPSRPFITSSPPHRSLRLPFPSLFPRFPFHFIPIRPYFSVVLITFCVPLMQRRWVRAPKGKEYFLLHWRCLGFLDSKYKFCSWCILRGLTNLFIALKSFTDRHRELISHSLNSGKMGTDAKFQKINPYNRFLPYADAIDQVVCLVNLPKVNPNEIL